jgi:hypothetical protein
MPKVPQTRELAAAPLRLIVVKKSIAVATGAMACLLSAGCGSLQLGTAAQTGAAGRTSAAPTAAGNRKLAEQEAVRLVSLAGLPGCGAPWARPLTVEAGLASVR